MGFSRFGAPSIWNSKANVLLIFLVMPLPQLFNKHFVTCIQLEIFMF